MQSQLLPITDDKLLYCRLWWEEKCCFGSEDERAYGNKDTVSLPHL